MAIFMFLNIWFLKRKTINQESGHISLILAPKEKNKTTLFPSTLKVWENKVVLFFHFEPNWGSYEDFMFQNFAHFIKIFQKEKNTNISLILARIQKIRPLYFLKLLKLKVIKWSYFLILSQNEGDMVIFLFFTYFPL